jgi:hypothetical protein
MGGEAGELRKSCVAVRQVGMNDKNEDLQSKKSQNTKSRILSSPNSRKTGKVSALERVYAAGNRRGMARKTKSENRKI